MTSQQAVIDLINKMEKQSKALKKEALKLCWHMRGGLSYTEAMQLSVEERQLVSEIANDNIEVTKKTGMPYF